ncbi:MAG: amidohydrolase family protein, partial [Candidatus Acidoferrales bacterium]
LVRRVSLRGGEPETLSATQRLFRSVFYLPDGRLAWMVVEREARSRSPHTARIEVMSPQGTVSTLRTLNGDADRAVPSPAGDGLYWHRRYPRSFGASVKDLSFVPLPDGAERQLFPVSGRSYWDPQFAVAADNKSLYLGQDGRLWKIELPSGAREHIAFRAHVRLEVQAPTPPPTWAPAAPGSSAPPRSILDPRLSPDGRTLVFGAAGYLWQQQLDGGQAERLFADSAVEREAAFSPDGRLLAFIRGEYGRDQVRVFDFDSRQMRTLASGMSYWGLSWSPDGQRLVFVERGAPDYRVVAVNLKDGKKEKLSEVQVLWWASPHLSADGQSLYFSDAPAGRSALYRLRLTENTEREPVTQLARHDRAALFSVSPAEKWLAFRQSSEIWVAPLGTEPVKEEQIRQLSADGGESFSFTPDGSAVIYAAGNRVWRQPLVGGEGEEIPIRLELRRPMPPPLLVRRVRVLDFAAGGFGGETSLYIEQGRIRWIGSEGRRRLPHETVIVDGGGRFAIPGLFDMHVHGVLKVSWQEGHLAYGITSVREPGGAPPFAWQNALADRSDTTSAPAPRRFLAGPSLSRFDSHVPPPTAVVRDVRTHVRRWKEWGAQFIKAYGDLSWPLRRAVSEEARRLGLPVAGHNTHFELTIKSVTLGYAGLEHLPNNDRLYDDVLQMLALAGTRWTPTLAVRGGNDLLLRDEPERLADAKFRAFTPEWRIRGRDASGAGEGAGDRAVRGDWMEKLASIRAAHRRGVKLQAGTDTPFRSSLHWELEYFVQAGIPPLDVLRIATQQAAEAVGAENDLGTLEPGKLADLVLLDKNPLEDIKNTQSIWRVIKG